MTFVRVTMEKMWRSYIITLIAPPHTLTWRLSTNTHKMNFLINSLKKRIIRGQYMTENMKYLIQVKLKSFVYTWKMRNSIPIWKLKILGFYKMLVKCENVFNSNVYKAYLRKTLLHRVKWVHPFISIYINSLLQCIESNCLSIKFCPSLSHASRLNSLKVTSSKLFNLLVCERDEKWIGNYSQCIEVPLDLNKFR